MLTLLALLTSQPITPFFWWLPADAARHGHALDHHLILNLWIALALLLLAHIILFAGLWLRRGQLIRNPWKLELPVLLVLSVLFAWFAVRAESLWELERYQGADAGAMQVEVTGVQFAWYFRYPGEDARFGETRPELVEPGAGNPLGINPADPHGADDFVSSVLVLPVGREVDLRLRALDVMHGFFVPAMRLKQDAVPGMTLHIHFTPEKVGEYPILCSQICGLGHYRMQATMRVVTPEEFERWVRAHERR